MRLLLDQNVSHRLAASLTHTFLESTQVGWLGPGEADDLIIWELAQREGYATVTHDADFEAYSVLAGGSTGDLAAVWQSTQGRDTGKINVAHGCDRARRGRPCRVVCRNLLENICKGTVENRK